jgi:hypothetical protein
MTVLSMLRDDTPATATAPSTALSTGGGELNSGATTSTSNCTYLY